MVDILHKSIVEQAFIKGSDKEYVVTMTFGELVLFHTLLQDYGIELVGDERFIPLMERNKKRIESTDG